MKTRNITISFIGALLLGIPSGFALALNGTIDVANHYAWNDNGGWVNWNPTNGNVTVTDTGLTGYIWSANFGWINLAPTQGGVINSNGTLSGYAWGQNTGWINFTGVTIDSRGRFHGSTVSQSLFGTMTFDCTNCNVATTWHSGGSGGNGTVIGPLSYGYISQGGASLGSSGQTNSSTTKTPTTLTPSTPPPTAQPKTPPQSNTTVPAHLTPSIMFSLYTNPTAVVGSPIVLTITFSNIKRTQNITYAYRLYAKNGAVVYAQTRVLKPTDASSFNVSIPTDKLPVGQYTAGVSAQYGKQSIATQTLPVGLYANKTDAENATTAVNGTSGGAGVCKGFWCWLINAIKRLFGH